MSKVIDKLIGVGVTLVTALVCFYFASFATDSRVDRVEARVTINKLELVKLKKFETNTQNMLCRFAGKILKPDDAYEVCKINP